VVPKGPRCVLLKDQEEDFALVIFRRKKIQSTKKKKSLNEKLAEISKENISFVMDWLYLEIGYKGRMFTGFIWSMD